MEGSSHLRTLTLENLVLHLLSPRTPSPLLFLLPEEPQPLHRELSQKFLLEGFATLLPETFDPETLRSLFSSILELLKREKVFYSSLWLWGEGEGALLALRLALEYPSEVAGLVLDSFRAQAREALKELFPSLRKPYLLFHPQLAEDFPFTQMERMFTLSPGQAKKLLLVPGMRRGEVLHKSMDLYVQTVTEFINPRAGRFFRKSKISH